MINRRLATAGFLELMKLPAQSQGDHTTAVSSLADDGSDLRGEYVAVSRNESQQPQLQRTPFEGGKTERIRAWSTAISQGNEEAFTRFYDIYSVRLYRHLLVLAKGNETEAREVLQTVVIKLAKRFKVFDDEQRMWYWLCRLTQNAWVDFCRSQKRHQRFVQLEEKTQGFEGACSTGEHQLAAGLQRALAELDDDDQELMRSAYIDRRSLQELAAASGLTYKAMESRLGRLRHKVKKKLLNYLGDENR